MMKTQRTLSHCIAGLCFLPLLLTSCSDDSITATNSSNSNFDWLIPQEQVVSGGPGKDGIPSIDSPQFAPASEIDYIPDDRRVIGIKIGTDIKAYPHQILDWHEIVNDQVGDEAVAITFCPLTGTAIGWNRAVGGTVTEFGVSGLLFRNNLIPYDRNSDSRWSQMQLRSVAGVLSGTTIETVDLIETSWATWKQMYPQSEVLTRETGFSRNYEGFAYGEGYSTSNSNILFPVQNPDDRLPNKDRVHGVLAQPPAGHEAIAKAYPINGFGDQIRVITDQVRQQNIIVVGSARYDVAASFKATMEDGTQLSFEPVQDSLPVVMKDQEGNRWDLFGYAVEGPRQGERLTPTLSYTGYWFGWADFFPEIEIHKPELSK